MSSSERERIIISLLEKWKEEQYLLKKWEQKAALTSLIDLWKNTLEKWRPSIYNTLWLVVTNRRDRKWEKDDDKA